MAIDAPIHTNQANLERVLGAGLPVFLVFWRRGCAPCDQFSGPLDSLARRYSGSALVVKVNADEEPGLLRRYHITSLPTTVLIKDGRELAKAVGAVAERDLAAWAEYMSGKGGQPPVPTGPSEPLPGATVGPAQGQRPEPPRTQPQSGPATGNGTPVTLTDSSFDQLARSSTLPVLVDCWAPWCGPCKMVAPVVESLAREFSGRVVVGKLNVDENPGVATRYGIMSIPTLLILRNGQVVDRVVGAVPGHVLRDRLIKQLG